MVYASYIIIPPFILSLYALGWLMSVRFGNLSPISASIGVWKLVMHAHTLNILSGRNVTQNCKCFYVLNSSFNVALGLHNLQKTFTQFFTYGPSCLHYYGCSDVHDDLLAPESALCHFSSVDTIWPHTVHCVQYNQLSQQQLALLFYVSNSRTGNNFKY